VAVLIVLIPLALVMAGLFVGLFIWSARSGQYEDPEGTAQRLLLDVDNQDFTNPRQ
jgi:cbb3-type cytochrome oxidase maturation protein